MGGGGGGGRDPSFSSLRLDQAYKLISCLPRRFLEKHFRLEDLNLRRSKILDPFVHFQRAVFNVLRENELA